MNGLLIVVAWPVGQDCVDCIRADKSTHRPIQLTGAGPCGLSPFGNGHGQCLDVLKGGSARRELITDGNQQSCATVIAKPLVHVTHTADNSEDPAVTNPGGRRRPVRAAAVTIQKACGRLSQSGEIFGFTENPRGPAIAVPCVWCYLLKGSVVEPISFLEKVRVCMSRTHCGHSLGRIIHAVATALHTRPVSAP